MKKSKIVSLIGLMGMFGSLASCTKINNDVKPSSSTPTSVSPSISTSPEEEERTTDENSFTYTTSGDSITITGLKEPNYTHIVIPDEIDGEKVTSILDDSFKNNSNIKTFKINKYITKISGLNFLGSNNLEKIEVDSENEKLKVENNCVLSKKETSGGSGLYTLYFGLGLYNLENAVISNNINEIKTYAFCGARFKKVTISASVTNIINTTFSYCSNLEDFEVEDGNTKYEVQEHSLIEKQSDGSKIFMCGTKNSNIPSDSAITKLDNYAFNGINRTDTLNIPANITTFKPYSNTSSCFKDSSIQKVTFDDNVNLDSSGFNSAFYGASKLEEVEIPSNIDFYSSTNLFDGCTSLKKVIFKSNIKNNNLSRKSFKDSLNKIEFEFGEKTSSWSQDEDGYVIYNDNSNGKVLKGYFGTDENVTLPEVKTIGVYAFYHSKVKNVTMPNTITFIGNSAFRYSSLETLSFSSSLTSIDSYCFANCDYLKTFTWPSSVKNIPADTFVHTNLELLVLASNTAVSDSALVFSNIKELKIDGDNPNYTVSDDKLTLLSKDGKTAVASFSDENGTITIPDTVTSLSTYVCYGRNAKEIILPVTVENCARRAFSYSNFETIEIKNPNISFTKNSTSDTANSSFYNTNNLKEITFHGTLEQFKTAFGSTKDEYNKLISKSITVKYKSSAEVETPDTTKTTDEIYA